MYNVYSFIQLYDNDLTNKQMHTKTVFIYDERKQKKQSTLFIVWHFINTIRSFIALVF